MGFFRALFGGHDEEADENLQMNVERHLDHMAEGGCRDVESESDGIAAMIDKMPSREREVYMRRLQEARKAGGYE